MSFRDNLIHLRAENHMTQERLAMMLGVSRQSVTKWEAEKSYPEMDKLIKMCQIFDCTLDDLVQGDLTSREPSAKTRLPSTTQPADIFGYDEHMSRFAMMISTGVVLPIIGVAIACIFFSLGPTDGTTDGNLDILPENIATALGLLFIFLGTIGCIAFVVPAGMNHSEFVKAHPYIENFYTAEQRQRMRNSFVMQLIGGICCIFIGIAVIVLFEGDQFEGVIGAPIMLLAIAIGIFFIVHGSMNMAKMHINNYNMAAVETLSSYEIAELDVDESQKEYLIQSKKRSSRKGAVCGIIMLIATIAGLVMLFVPGYRNELFWLSWPIGGILCGIVALLFNAVTGESDD